MKCRARQYSDQMICAACGLTWDTNDPDPPACRQHGTAKGSIEKIAFEPRVKYRSNFVAPTVPYPENVQPNESAEFLYRCKFCGAPSQIDPYDQTMPVDYCHPGDHTRD